MERFGSGTWRGRFGLRMRRSRRKRARIRREKGIGMKGRKN